jgi:DNA-binding LacI/PurR family transcriptional regulator
MGRMAMEGLLKILEGSSSKTDIGVAGELIVRDSSAPPKHRSRES